MKERKEILKSVIYSVTPRGSIKTNKPSTVEMTVDHRFANKADELYQDLKEGIEPQGKLIRLELVAVYAEEEVIKKTIPFSENKIVQDFLDSGSEAGVDEESTEQKIQEMSDELDSVLTEKGDE